VTKCPTGEITPDPFTGERRTVADRIGPAVTVTACAGLEQVLDARHRGWALVRTGVVFAFVADELGRVAGVVRLTAVAQPARVDTRTATMPAVVRTSASATASSLSSSNRPSTVATPSRTATGQRCCPPPQDVRRP
jgi:hypothetical protein